MPAIFRFVNFFTGLRSVKRRYSGEAVPDFDRSVVDGDRVAVLSRMKTEIMRQKRLRAIRAAPRFHPRTANLPALRFELQKIATYEKPCVRHLMPDPIQFEAILAFPLAGMLLWLHVAAYKVTCLFGTGGTAPKICPFHLA